MYTCRYVHVRLRRNPPSAVRGLGALSLPLSRAAQFWVLYDQLSRAAQFWVLYDPLSRAAQFWVLYDPELRRGATEFPSDRPGAAVSVDAARRLCIHADMSTYD